MQNADLAELGVDIGTFRLSRFVIPTEPFDDPATGKRLRIVFGTRKGVWRSVEESDWFFTTSLRFDRLEKQFVQDLVENEILVPSSEDELQTIINRNRKSIQDSRELYQVVQPTDSCQLGCDYCGQVHGRRQLSLADQQALAERIEGKVANRTFDSLRVAWFGAEPLAALGVIRNLSTKLLDIAERYCCKYSALVVTNGMLLDPTTATELVKEFRVGLIEVTLDGSSKYHNLRRATKTGSQTFNRIYENVRALALREDLQVDLRIRCNVDSRNKDGVLPLIQQLADDGLAQRLSFYVAPIHSWGNGAGNLLDIEEFAAWQVEWFSQLARLGFKIKLIPGRIESVCMAVQPSADLVDASGSLFNCTEVSYVPAYEGQAGRSFAQKVELPIIGQSPHGQSNIYSIGSLREGENTDKRRLLADFNDRVAAAEYPCAECELFPVCGGRCPKLWMEGTPPCPPEKYNIQQRLILAHLLSCRGRTIEHIAGSLVSV